MRKNKIILRQFTALKKRRKQSFFRLRSDKGFSMVELIVTISLLALAISVTISAVNYSDRAKFNTSSRLLSALNDIEAAFNLYYLEKSSFPTGFNDDQFVPKYIFIPSAPEGFLKTWTAAGAETGGTTNIGFKLATSGTGTGQGFYVCAKTAAAVKPTDNVFLGIQHAAESTAVSKLIYSTGTCPQTANSTPAAEGASVYVTYWLTKN